MRWLALLLIAACAAPPEPIDDDVAALVDQADEAISAADWSEARRMLEQAAFSAPAEPVVLLRQARVELEAYGEIERAEALYLKLPGSVRARQIHGLGLCALWRGDEDRAIQLFEESLKVAPTTACARDLAVRRLGRGEPADAILDLVDEISGATLRSQLLLAAAGRGPRPERLPEGWSYGLERARLLPLAEARREVEAYLARACASKAAREKMKTALEGDFALRRNPEARPAVK